MPLSDKDRYAETAFKRFYWQGYKGRFGLFRWPTFYTQSYIDPTDSLGPPLDPHNFDASEFNSWRSSTGLLQLLNTLKGTYCDSTGNSRVRVFAHSHGNLATSEALRKAVGPVVHTYVATQAAIAAHCFDRNQPDISATWTNGKWYLWALDHIPGMSVGVKTPNLYAYYPAGSYAKRSPMPEDGDPYMASMGGAAKCVNYFNVSDWALDAWITDQALKPDTGVPEFGGTTADYTYRYFDTEDDSTVPSLGYWFRRRSAGWSSHFMDTPTDTYEIFSYAAQARSQPLGRQRNVMGVFNGQQTEWSKYGDKHPGHSAQFRSSIVQRWDYWNRLLVDFALKTPQ
jgi:hypothetical protein